MIPLTISLAAFAILLMAELIHGRRIVKTRGLTFPGLAFGQRKIFNAAMVAAMLLRCIAVGGFTWGLITLWSIPPLAAAAADLPDGKIDPANLRHIILVIDVSPSMAIKDSGEHGNISRAQQAGAMIMNALSQLDMRYARVSVIAFFTDAKPVVIDTIDPNIVQNFVSRLPLINAFEDGETSMIKAISKSFELAEKWDKGSTSILMATDGDSVPLIGMPKPPESVRQIVLAGVGDASAGTFIDGHFSRQDARSLKQIAGRLHGDYFNTSTHGLPPDLMQSFSGTIGDASPAHFTDLRWWSMLAIITSSTMFLIIPWLQVVFDRWASTTQHFRSMRGSHA